MRSWRLPSALLPIALAACAATESPATVRWGTRRIVENLRHEDGVTALEFGPRGAVLLSGDCSGDLAAWGAATGVLLWKARAHRGAVLRAAVSPDGALAASLGEDHRVVARDLATGAQRWSARLPEGGIAVGQGLAFSPDGTRIAAAGLDPCVHILSAADGRILHSIVTEGSTSLAWAVDGARVFAGSWSCEVAILDPATGIQIGNWVDPGAGKGAFHGVLALAPSADGKLLAEGDEDGTVRFWDAVLGKPLFSYIAVDRPVLAIDEEGLAVGGGMGYGRAGSRPNLDIAIDGDPLPAIFVAAAALSPSVRRMALGTREGRVLVLEAVAAGTGR